ncbi:serine/threonine-protein kinase [Actinoplanes sp. OR16]|uniref:serine/threonine-protein kinase n=1 Tax=Actinoplanes sp. OR16 TaxID=946334 RepID=UPI000FD94A87|nr:serine/threonine-protein kinase [Actinoplanes sp. OR16]
MSTTDLPGSGLLAGRYRLVERLGAGGMSVVWRGFDEVLGRQVAIKVLPPSTSTDPSFRRRLRAEAQAAARLTHPHITNVYDYGEATTVDGEPVPYVVMELVDGESLAAILARVRMLPWPTAVRISAEVAAALASAHARGIVHRDVTPANVMLTPAGSKVVDFGISALIGENDVDPDGSLLGTPAYLAPERLEGGQVSPATDVYAVGLLIYRMLIGQLPWDVGTTTALLRAHQYTEPEPLPPVEGLPPAVEALIGRCLEKRPEDRPPTAELAHVLAGISAGAPLVTSGFDATWQDGEDTFILPSGYPYAGMGPAAAAAVGPTDPSAVHPVVAQAVTEPSALPEARPPAADPPPLRPGARGPAAGSPPGRAADTRKRTYVRRGLLLAGSVALLSALTYGWTALGQPQNENAAGLGGAAPLPSVVPVSGTCVVSYAVWSDDKKKFKAQVTLANRADDPIDEWDLWFLMPGDQVVSGNGKTVLKQDGSGVTVSSVAALAAQKTTTMQISGRYVDNNAAPMLFMLNGQRCEAYVSGEPGEPSRPVEHLADGGVRFGDPATTPSAGISIDPGGNVHITPTVSVRPSTTKTPGIKPVPSGSTTTAPEPGTSTSQTTTDPEESESPPPPDPPSVSPSDPVVEPPSPSPSTSPPPEPGTGIDDPCDPEVPEECPEPVGSD